MKSMKMMMKRKLLSPEKLANTDRNDSGFDGNNTSTNLLKDVMPDISMVKNKEYNKHQSLTPLVEDKVTGNRFLPPIITKKLKP